MRDGLVAAALGAAGLGAVVGRPAVALLATVPLAVLAAGAIAAPTTPAVRVSRSVSDTAPGLGDRVTVLVTVENDGPTVSDCLIEDAVPEALGALERPARSVRLPAGATATLEYRVVARRGSHEFGAVKVTARGAVESASVTHDAESTLECRPESRPLQLRAPASRRLDDAADTSGSGVEFHSVREYRPSDPQRRIDWRRFARTRELTTVEFREPGTETVYVVVDARPGVAVRAGPAEPLALSYCVDAAERLAGALATRQTAVGVGLYPHALAAVPPGTGRSQRARIERLLADRATLSGHGEAVAAPDSSGGGHSPDGPSPAPDRDAGTAALPELAGDARIVLLSPCLDDAVVEFAVSVHAGGRDIGVIAPDIGGGAPGAVVERALRERRLGELEGAGLPFVSWRVETRLERAVEEVFATWT